MEKTHNGTYILQIKDYLMNEFHIFVTTVLSPKHHDCNIPNTYLYL